MRAARRMVIAIGLLLPWVALAAETPGDTQFDFANGLFHRGFFEEAVEEYGRFLAENPDSPEAATARYRLGESAYSAGRYEEAHEAFVQLLAAPSLDEDMRRRATLSMGEVRFHLKRVDDALAVLEPLAKEGVPAEIRARALYYVAKAQSEKGAHAQARDYLLTLVEALPDHALAPYARYDLAFVYLALAEPESAAIEFSAVASSEADAALRAECRYRAAETYDKIGWYSAAVGAYEKLRTEFSDSAYARKADYGYGWALYHAGNYPEALAAAEAFLKARPDSAYLPGLTYLKGNCLQQQRKYDEALVLYQGLREGHGDTEFGIRAQYRPHGSCT